MLRQSLAVLGILLALTGVVLGRSDIRYIYDELGRLVGVVDQNGDSAIYRYDAVGNVTSIVRIPAGQVSIIEFTPNQGPVGTAVIILGTAFGTTATENTVQFNGITASIIEASSTRLVVTVPAGASTGPISVTAPLGTGTSADSFSVSASSRAPTLTGFTPAVGIAGTAVTISGTNFELIASSNRLTFNRSMGVAAGATSISLSTTVPSNTGSGKISVSTPYGTATSTDDFFIPPSPYLPADVGFTSRVAPGESRTLSLPNPTKVGLVVFDSTAGNQVGIKFSAVTIGSSQVSILRPDGSYQLAPTSVGTAGRVVYSGSLPVNGTYTIFVDPDGSNVGSATLNLQTVNTAITMTPGSSVAGANMTAGWTAVPFLNGSDIVRMFTTGGVDTGKAQWTGGTASGSMSYSIPATTAAGSYQLRFYAENSTLLATSNTFTVTACTTASLSETPGTVVAGGSVAVTWSGVCAPNGSDIVRMFTTGGVDTGKAQWTGGTASGSMSYSIPATTAAGSYQLRFYAENSTLLATSNTFTVTACTTASLSETPGTVVAGGSVAVTWSGVCAPNGSDIVRMFTTGGVNTGAAQWTGGTASGSLSFSIPAAMAAGSYQLRFYAQNSALLATSNTFTVTACTTASLSETPGTVVAGGSVTVTWSGVCAPNGSDIVRMFTTGGVNTGAAQWTGGTASGSLSFSIPAAMAAGSYQLRFYAQNSALLVTSNTFTVTTSDLDLDETQADSTLRVVADQVQRKTQPRARLSHTALLMLPRRRGKDHGR